MGLFSGRPAANDGRPRELELVGVPVIAADMVGLDVDMVLRFEPRPPHSRPDFPGHLFEARWREVDDAVVEAVVITILRLHAEDRSSTELLADRAGLVESVETGLRIAPIPAMYDARTVRAEIRPATTEVRSSVTIRAAT